MMLTPRYYQRDAVDGCWDYLSSGKGRAPLLVEPTGSGKSLIISLLIQEALGFDPGARVLIVTDSRELVRQNYAEFIGTWADAPAGVYAAGLNRRDMHARILFASIQSIYKRAYQVQQCDILIIDECHMIPAQSDAMYQKLITDLRAINPGMPVIGMTATPFRGNGIPLHGDGQLFDGIAHETTVAELLAEGYLCPPVGFNRGVIRTDGVRTVAGEYNTAQAEAVAIDPDTIRQTCDIICQSGDTRRAWKIFGVSTAHCDALHAELTARGFIGDCVYGHTDTDRGKGTRDRIIGAFDRGELRYLISNAALTKGFNVKRIDMVVLAYITKSLVKYIQTIGRGTRVVYAHGMPLETAEQRRAAIAAGPKPNCLVIDLGKNITRCGPFDDPFIRDKKGKGGGEAPYKTCPEPDCGTDCATSTRYCPACGHEFPPPEPKVLVVPDEKPVLSVQTLESDWLDVTGVSYAPHAKIGSPTSLRVTYQVGLTTHREWVCLEHSGYARTKAEGWWLRRAPAPVPATVAEAIERQDQIRTPSHIRLQRAGKYDEIAGFRFEPIGGAAEAA